MNPETKQFTYIVWRYLLVGPLFAAPIIWLGMFTSEFLVRPDEPIPLSNYPAIVVGSLFMAFFGSYFMTTSSALACGLYRATCLKLQRPLNLTLYYLFSIVFSAIFIRTVMGIPTATLPAVASVLGGLFLAYKMLGARVTPVDNPYAHIVPEKHSQPSIFSNIMLLYVLGIPAIATLLLTFAFAQGASLRIHGIHNLITISIGGYILAMLQLFPWMPGLYIARCAANQKPVSREEYYLWALRSGYAFPTLITLIAAIGRLIYGASIKSLYALVAGYSFVAICCMLVTVLSAALFLVITERWLKNTPFALRFKGESA